MLKKFMNSVMPLALVAVMSFSWGDLIPTNSLLFFGEPDYPIQK